VFWARKLLSSPFKATLEHKMCHEGDELKNEMILNG
jgi:hypothetical protein